ncbi:Uma2 family endonuclease [Allocoleopsis sp.]|uniref:Uma2 family endonuclease n=1 Tax=Allocoleopsis sp. TaxID=3088169 RepID=UPI002FD34289
MTPLTVASDITSNSIPKWQPATWKDYVAYYEDPNLDEVRVFFDRGYLFVDMGNEGINHSRFARLFAMLFGFWFARKPEQIAEDLGGCVIEKPETQGASPDIVLYMGEEIPQWQEGEPRRINLNKWRVPNLVGEVADTTLATDLDEKKRLYSALQIPEYWVIDIKGERVLAFYLQENGKYQQIENSVALEGLPIFLLEQTLAQMNQGTNVTAALWFAQQIANL